MKAKNIISLVTAFVVMVALVMGTTRTSVVKPDSDLWGKESEGFQLSALVEKNQFKSASSIVLKLRIRNITKQDLHLVETFPEDEYKIVVKTERGENVPLTKIGQRLLVNEGINFRVRAVKVGSKEERQDSIEITKLYDMTVLGSYSITAKRKVQKLDGKGWSEVISNAVNVTIVR